MSPITPTPIQAPVSPQTINAWVLEITDFGLTSPNFSKVSGPSIETGVVTHPDGGTGQKYKFSDHTYDYGQATLVRVRDGGANDALLASAVKAAILAGSKHSGTFTKYHHGSSVATIAFTGLLFKKINKPDFDTEGSGKYEETIECEVDYWEETIS
jgi:hypothetical protein